jgi:hypothetical protein
MGRDGRMGKNGIPKPASFSFFPFNADVLQEDNDVE